MIRRNPFVRAKQTEPRLVSKIDPPGCPLATRERAVLGPDRAADTAQRAGRRWARHAVAGDQTPDQHISPSSMRRPRRAADRSRARGGSCAARRDFALTCKADAAPAGRNPPPGGHRGTQPDSRRIALRSIRTLAGMRSGDAREPADCAALHPPYSLECAAPCVTCA